MIGWLVPPLARLMVPAVANLLAGRVTITATSGR